MNPAAPHPTSPIHDIALPAPTLRPDGIPVDDDAEPGILDVVRDPASSFRRMTLPAMRTAIPGAAP